MAFLDASIAHGELFLAELDGVLAGCMVLNHAYNDGYAAVTWAADVPDAQLLVIHALGVHPAFARRGIAHGELFLAELDGVLAGCMVQYAIGTARSGRPVRVVRGELVRTGFAEAVDDDFALVVRWPDGARETVTGGDVSVRGLFGYLD